MERKWPPKTLVRSFRATSCISGGEFFVGLPFFVAFPNEDKNMKSLESQPKKTNDPGEYDHTYIFVGDKLAPKYLSK